MPNIASETTRLLRTRFRCLIEEYHRVVGTRLAPAASPTRTTAESRTVRSALALTMTKATPALMANASPVDVTVTASELLDHNTDLSATAASATTAAAS